MYDLRDLLLPRREAVWQQETVVCRGATARAVAEQVVVSGPLGELSEQLDALWAIVQLTWRSPELDAATALTALDKLP